ncbi:maleylacetoacetate isomerase [Piscirickettsia litoralis]|uniref:Maleylacetoacetate isomerase n=1 Tax=Piscirickettsia litoralis TaxID=1891921 RepID=A0ABX3A6Q4_9GAMM|nr:maleylacetoacetate isomerase [Piscirickettsia litoralis]ODN43175.1 maleylacetoacetate isomerase [Piscirickettsia litoralis]
MKLYGYFRSSASFRVRIALALKEINYENIPVHLLNEGGEQYKADYTEINPQQLVPSLIDGEAVITQSLAIVEYLDAKYPGVMPLVPKDIWLAAKARQIAYAIACDIHPMNNLRVLQYLKGELKVDDEVKNTWYHHWVLTGFTAIEKMLGETCDQYCLGDQLSLADVCLIPQVYNAKRFNCDLTKFPRILAIYEHCMEHDAFIQAAPENQPDAG